MTYFTEIDKITFEGNQSENPFAYKWYDKDQIVMGKSMQEHLRFAVCYWHTFCWPGTDPFGDDTIVRPWMSDGDPMKMAELKLNVAFEFFEKLGVPFYCFHDRDVAPEGASLRESNSNLDHIVDLMEQQIEQTGVKLLWGTANLFSHRRFMAGSGTNPDPDVFAYAAAQVKHVLEATNRLGGENYVLWGGREGYDTLLNTDLKQESDQLGRFMNLVVEHKHKIGFKGTILIEPKPQEPTKHQYDYDSATVHGFLMKYGLEGEIFLNIEANHATLAGHSFEHELSYATTNGILGSIDMNRGDPQNMWDTDQFPNSIPEVAMALYVIMNAGGFSTGGVNFDAKLRRQSTAPEDLFHAHIGAMDVCARGLLIAADMIEDGRLESNRQQRYAGWKSGFAQDMLAGNLTMEDISTHVLAENLDPQPVSGGQEKLENLVNRFL